MPNFIKARKAKIAAMKTAHDAQSLADIAKTVEDANFNESDHPRAENGKFGSGGGGSSGAEKTKTSKASATSKIQGMPSEKLHAALKTDLDPGIRKLVEKELDERANSGR
jgi:hypothetical protein